MEGAKSSTGTTTEVLSKVAHDLRNPLNSISMNAELVKLKLQRAGDTEQVIAYLDRILQECRNCSSVLETSIRDPKD